MDNSDFPTDSSGDVEVTVVTTYLPGHSKPEQNQFVFAYTITISNAGDMPVQLLSRHWIITDADSEVQEVRGEGVVGEQPVIHPGKSFRYTSGATLATPVGCMEGSYTMVRCISEDRESPDEGQFEVPIPAFSLHTPTAVH
ncbi:MAG: Co2+/Mg2+ efflux protein ApaG [Pseudomonadota bacterium]